jgi:hypothetical protein
MRRACHLSLRLRDQLLAFSSVRAVTLLPGQLAPLGQAFSHLASLSVSGKVAVSGRVLVELLEAVSGASSSSGSSSSSRSRRGLLSLSLDVHFVGVNPRDVAAALAQAPNLKVRGIVLSARAT